MEKIKSLNDFSLMDFSKTAGEEKSKYAEIYYERKNNKIRMYDENHIIKTSGNNLEFLELLKSLNIEYVNSPVKILQDEKNSNKFYIVCKYLNDCLELDFYKNIIPFNEILDYLIKVLITLENCHQNDFYVGDLHISNILISPDKKAYIFDFDQSIFIKEKIITMAKDETLFTLYDNVMLKEMLQNRYGIKEEDLTFYNANIELLKSVFMEYDKEYILRGIIRLIFLRLGMKIDEYSFTKHDISKLSLSRNFEKKLNNCLIQNIPLSSDDYLIDEINELKESRLIRKKLNR